MSSTKTPMAAPPPIADKVHLTSKAKILEAASDLFLAGGLGALSVRAIAKRAGVSTIGIYSHFNGKQGVLDTLYIEGFTQVSQVVAPPPDESDPVTAILAAIERYIDTAQLYGAHYRLIFGEADADYVPSSQAKAAGIKAFERLVHLVGRALPPDASLAKRQTFAMNIWAIAHGFISLRHNAISDLILIKDWRPMIMEAVALHVRAYIAAGAGDALADSSNAS